VDDGVAAEAEKSDEIPGFESPFVVAVFASPFAADENRLDTAPVLAAEGALEDDADDDEGIDAGEMGGGTQLEGS
jgi:hypothetical protein